MEFVPLLVLGLVVRQVTDLLKQITNRDVNAVVTQVLAWLAGVGLAFLVGASDFGRLVPVGSSNLGAIDGPAKLLVGLVFLAIAGAAHDLKKAVDTSNSTNSNTTLIPPL